MQSICVFCGANFNGDQHLKDKVELLAQAMVSQGVTLIYGGARVGLMGILADAVLNGGGKVIGVMPQFLIDKEVAHTGLTELRIVESMHQRKQVMNDLANGIIMLPGGFGTLEEFFEVLTWLQLGLHNNPVGILNINGFYDLLLKQMDLMVEQHFLKQTNRDLVLSSANPIELIAMMNSVDVKPDEVWFRDKKLS